MLRAGGPCVNGSRPVKLLDHFDDISQIREEHRGIVRIQLEALAEYAPSPYSGKVVLLRTHRHPLFCSYDSTLGWNTLAPDRVDVRYISGPHHRLTLEPHVHVLASELRICLSEAQNRSDTAHSD